MDSGRGWSSLGWSHTLKEGGHLLQVTRGGQMEARLVCLSRHRAGGHLMALGLQAQAQPQLGSQGPGSGHVPFPAKPPGGV